MAAAIYFGLPLIQRGRVEGYLLVFLVLPAVYGTEYTVWALTHGIAKLVIDLVWARIKGFYRISYGLDS
ncbi:MAG: hypothetical protein QW313_07250 [Candidatus Caldarchaeum sp.]